MKNNLEQTQSILYLGYVLLVVLGIINESLFYSQFGINILEYSDVLDVLLSPISKLTSNKALMIISCIVISILLIVPRQVSKSKEDSRLAKFFKVNPSEEGIEQKLRTAFIVFSVLFFVGIFVGAGSGSAVKLKRKLKAEEVEFKDTIQFMDGQAIDVEVIGKNSNYIFYLEKGDDLVKISPISGAIKSLTINK